MTDHPITPPPELVEQWKAELPTGVFDGYKFPQREQALCIQAARWGADQELEACCEWMDRRLFGRDEIRELRAARRPTPPSLKEQALHALGRFSSNAHTQASQMIQDFEIIRRAVEELP